MLAPAPAPACTRTSFFAASLLTVSGVAATRVSPARVSAGTPILIRSSPKGSGEILPRHAEDGTLGELEGAVHHKGERGGRQRTREQHRVVVQGESLHDACPEAAGADEGGDGRGADIDHRGGLDAGHDGRRR